MVEIADDEVMRQAEAAGWAANPRAARLSAEHAELAHALPYEEVTTEQGFHDLDAAHAVMATDAIAPHYGRYVVFHHGRLLGSRPDPVQAVVELGREHGINPVNLYVAKAFDPRVELVSPDDFY